MASKSPLLSTWVKLQDRVIPNLMVLATWIQMLNYNNMQGDRLMNDPKKYFV